MRRIFLMAFFGGLLSSFSASAEGTLWTTEGDWDIYVTDTDAADCFAARQFDDGTLVQIGTANAQNGWFFAAYNAGWTHLEMETDGDVAFEFYDVIFAGRAEIRRWNGVPGGYVFFNNPEFLDAFGRQMSLRIGGPEGRGIEISLSGTKRAVTAVENCRDAEVRNQDK